MGRVGLVECGRDEDEIGKQGGWGATHHDGGPREVSLEVMRWSDSEGEGG